MHFVTPNNTTYPLQINVLMLFREIIVVYYEHSKNRINEIYVKTQDFIFNSIVSCKFYKPTYFEG
jgi:hypothetical protein